MNSGSEPGATGTGRGLFGGGAGAVGGGGGTGAGTGFELRGSTPPGRTGGGLAVSRDAREVPRPRSGCGRRCTPSLRRRRARSKCPSADIAPWCNARPPRARSPECSASLRSWFSRGKARDVPERSSAGGRSSTTRLPSTVRQLSPPTSSAAKPTRRPTRDNEEWLARPSRLAEGVTPTSARRLADPLGARESNRSIPSTRRGSTPPPLVKMLPSSCSGLIGRKTGIYL